MPSTPEKDLSVPLQTEPHDVDEWPLCVALKKMCPNLQDGEAQASGVSGHLGLLVVEVHYRIGFRHDAPDPVEYSIFAVFWLVSYGTISGG